MTTEPNDYINACGEFFDENGNNCRGIQGGLSKREYFAAMAIEGICSYHGSMGLDEEHVKRNAKFAVKQADALIKALNEGE